MGYIDNIEDQTLQNTNFRKYFLQVNICIRMLMSLKPNEEIGEAVP
jgi:hypothetical protein